MKLDKNIFRSRLARRMFFSFVLCALVPILVLFAVTFTHVTKHFESFARDHLKRTTKAHGMAIFEKLLLLESELKNTALYIHEGFEHSQIPHDLADDSGNFSRFRSKFILTEENSVIPICSNCETPPVISKKIRGGLLSGKTAIATRNFQGKPSRVFLITALDQKHIKDGVLVGEVNISYLWGIGSQNNLPANTGIYVLDENNNILIQSFPVHDISEVELSQANPLESEDGSQRYLTSEWSIFLKSHFHAPIWKILLAQEKALIQAPLDQFKRIFPLVVLLSIWFVLLFTIASIRKNLIPLQILKEGTVRVSKGDFKSRVTVKSHDEFQDLAVSFNEMSLKLSRQFDTLTAIEGISNTAFSHQGSSSIILSLLSALSENSLDTSLYLVDQRGNAQAYITEKAGEPITPYSKPLKLTEEDLNLLNSDLKTISFSQGEIIPEFLAPLQKEGLSNFTLAPFFTSGKLTGFLARGLPDTSSSNEEDFVLVHRLADQLSITLSNAKLVEDLNSLSRGTLRALARTVDMKSPWTAGHSERVAKLAVQIGKNMGFSKPELEKLDQAGLLHDIGKIGVPATILDKPGKLSDEEFATIKQHPSLGVRILEPINTFEEIIPPILHHHERFDGNGYPEGLKGHQISLGGRILAVADVYDALASDRPYRPGWENSRIFDLLKEESGQHFDPDVVDAFLKLDIEVGKKSQLPLSKVAL
jgi:putative nucleotidyltransferase with HDIG domain